MRNAGVWLLSICRWAPAANAVDYVGDVKPILQKHCMSCHGMGGQGGIAVQSIGVNPPLRQITKSFTAARMLSSKSEFIQFVTLGLAGRVMPGFAHFSSAEWDELYQYVRNLSHR